MAGKQLRINELKAAKLGLSTPEINEIRGGYRSVRINHDSVGFVDWVEIDIREAPSIQAIWSFGKRLTRRRP